MKKETFPTEEYLSIICLNEFLEPDSEWKEDTTVEDIVEMFTNINEDNQRDPGLGKYVPLTADNSEYYLEQCENMDISDEISERFLYWLLTQKSIAKKKYLVFVSVYHGGAFIVKFESENDLRALRCVLQGYGCDTNKGTSWNGMLNYLTDNNRHNNGFIVGIFNVTDSKMIFEA